MDSRKRQRDHDRDENDQEPTTENRSVIFSVPRKNLQSSIQALQIVNAALQHASIRGVARTLTDTNDRYFVKVVADVAAEMQDAEIINRMKSFQQIVRLDVNYVAKMDHLRRQNNKRQANISSSAEMAVSIALKSSSNPLTFVDIVKGATTAVSMLKREA